MSGRSGHLPCLLEDQETDAPVSWTGLDPSLGRLGVTKESRSDELRERASKPKSSRLDAALGRLEMTEGLRSDKSGVGE